MKHKMQLPKNPRQFIGLIILALLGLIILFNVTEQTRSTQRMSYSSFIKKVEEGHVKEVAISGQQAIGILDDNKTKFETVLPSNDPQQWDLFKKHNVNVNVSPSEPDSGWGGSWIFMLIASLIIFAAILWYLLRKNQGSGGSGGPGGNIFNVGKSRAKMILPTQIKTNFSHVAGATEAKQGLADVIEYLKNPDKFKRVGGHLPRGILLVGEPGNGKTLLAKAVAGEANCPFFSVTGSDFVEVFVGVGAARIRDLFAQARKHAPCIIFIDEIDAIGRQRGVGLGGGNDEREQTLNQLLTEIDGFDGQNVPIVVIAATNIPQVLDKALMRPGRFDRRITVPYPDAEAREAIIRIQAREIKISAEIDIKKVVEETSGFTGADVSNLINLAALEASKKGHDMVLPEDIEEARKQVLKSHETQMLENRRDTVAKVFMPQQIKLTFKDVAGLPEAKEEVLDIIDYLKDPARFKRLGARGPRGILFVGEPGNGKTLLAKAIAGEANRPFLSVSGSDFVEVYVGMGASRIRELFAEARRNAPSIIFIDEIDAVGAKRSSYTGGGSEYNQTLNQLLCELDGFNTMQADVIIIAATNRVDILDDALTRPGRFDREVYIPYPDIKAREEILQVHARKIIMDPTVDLSVFARATTGFSGASLEQLVNEAAIIASKANKAAVTMEDLEEARDKIIMGKEIKSITRRKKDIERTAYHEAGHALVNLMLPDCTDPLYKVTIVPRGHSLGSTHFLPEVDKYGQTREEMLGRIMVGLGGRIAEEIKFNVLSTGASQDFKNASNIARTMVCYYGMSESLGTITYEPGQGNFPYSQETAAKIDAEVSNIIKRCYDKAKAILVEHQDKLEKLATMLLEKETVQANEVCEALGIPPRAEVTNTTSSKTEIEGEKKQED